MVRRAGAWWRSARDSFWFAPALMTLGGVALSFVTGAIDEQRSATVDTWYFDGGHEGARTLLSALAGSMITVASLVFSITIVALTLASQQFGPRLLRNFMRDTGNQVVLGTFLATFMYCLLTLRSVRGGSAVDDEYVPELSITVALVLAALSIGVLIWFIDHVASSIRIPTLVSRVGSELDSLIDRLYPDAMGTAATEDRRPGERGPLPDGPSCAICSQDSGYVQSIDPDALLGTAEGRDILIRVEHRPGDWVVDGNVLATAWPAERVTGEVEREVRTAFMLGNDRTPEQDVRFPILQLVEIAARALSPGLNDPHTAITCIDRLSASLSLAVSRKFPASHRAGGDGTLRVIAAGVSQASLIDAAFDSIRQYGAAHVSVNIRLLASIATIAERASDADARAALARQATMIERGAQEAVKEPLDRDDISRRARAVLEDLGAA